MTYTVIVRDNRTGQLGIGIATYSLAVGASCPFVRPGVGAVSSQAATYPAHGPALLEMIASSTGLPEAFAQLADADEQFEYRQVGVVTADGTPHVHTGSATRDWAGSLIGNGWLVMGNVLDGDHVASQMAAALKSGVDEPLAQRMLLALEAGRDTGGQRGLGGRHLPERSAVLTVYGEQPFADIDLRVDDHPDAVTELRRVHDRFMRADGYYRSRAASPSSTPPQDKWMAENGIE